MRYLDKQQNRLIYIQRQATPDFWDRHWQADNNGPEANSRANRSYVVRITAKYLRPQDGIILEGGCGTAAHVAALVNSGYRCIGVDYAQQTVRAVNEASPDLDIRWGDVRSLAFEDGHFAGYWSMGVIEHFWEGYRPIAMEMARVLKPGGYLFLTFPHMSWLRGLKAKLGLYPDWQKGQQPPANFYQFALDSSLVTEDFTRWGFELVITKPLSGLKGLKDEISYQKGTLQNLYDYRGKSRLIRGLRYGLSTLSAPLAGHTVLLIFKRLSYQSNT